MENVELNAAAVFWVVLDPEKHKCFWMPHLYSYGLFGPKRRSCASSFSTYTHP